MVRFEIKVYQSNLSLHFNPLKFKYKFDNICVVIHRFLGSNNHETYFTATQRSRVVWEILTTAVYGKRKRAEIGIERLIEEGVYSAAFPLHDVSGL